MFQFNIRLNFPQRKRKHRTGPEMQSSKLTTQLAISLTKRMILSQVNGIHDLLGLATSFKLRNFRKLFVGQNKQFDWDKVILMELTLEWMQFFKYLFQMEKIQFDQCLKAKNAVGNQSLVLFSDGSDRSVFFVCLCKMGNR